ncbi:MAG: hypothetical protein K2M98_00035 [Muribaculum sp.]|nr:hypothetical protein [Muribaculum sp.]
MKYKAYILLGVNIVITITQPETKACGPYNPIIPTPSFFELETPKRMSDYDRAENLHLWQALTSDKIPLKDIEQVVYRDSKSVIYDNCEDSNTCSKNLMYTYLYNTADDEIKDFLYIAKSIEETWHEMQSPWYYPQDRNKIYIADEFQYAIEKCKNYDGTRLKDRYALQIVRALFASRQYEKCIEYYDSAFVSFPATNLMKRMALRYVAGCWSRMDEDELADSLLAQTGDICSISEYDRVDYMIKHNPNAPQIIDYIRSNMTDLSDLLDLVPAAKKLLKNKSIKYKGDWAFLLAYFYKEYAHDSECARKYMAQAMKNDFSTSELKDLARAYKMKIDAHFRNTATLLTDLKWIENKFDVLNPEANEWIRRTRNIIYEDWIPQLWQNKEYPTAIWLASYADNILPSQQMHITHWTYLKPDYTLPLDSIRNSSKYTNGVDYSSLSFQLMGSLSSSELIHTYEKMFCAKPLYFFLRKNGRVDSDYYNELIGTLALREENYSRAIAYLSKVSRQYLCTMNVYKEGYMNRDPFIPYPTLQREWRYNSCPGNKKAKTGNYDDASKNVKLDFAKKMQEYKYLMNNGKTTDERSWGRLLYTIGRRNSFESCWALTQYWRGYIPELFMPLLYHYSKDPFAAENYSFLYDYENSVEADNTETTYQNEIEQTIAMFQTDEYKAKAEYLFGNVETCIKKYPDTKMAKYLQTHCDNWHNWL